MDSNWTINRFRGPFISFSLLTFFDDDDDSESEIVSDFIYVHACFGALGNLLKLQYIFICDDGDDGDDVGDAYGSAKAYTCMICCCCRETPSSMHPHTHTNRYKTIMPYQMPCGAQCDRTRQHTIFISLFLEMRADFLESLLFFASVLLLCIQPFASTANHLIYLFILFTYSFDFWVHDRCTVSQRI